MADPWSGSQFGGSSAYDQLFGQIQGNTGPGGFVWNQQNTQGKLDQYGNDFVQQFTNAVGRAPTADEINQYFSQAVTPVGSSQAGFSGTDPNAIASAYVPQAFQSQIQQNQAAQLPNLESQIANIGTQVGQQTAQQLANPTSGAFQAFSGQMNNSGISPSSGAFQQGLGNTIGSAASGAIQQGLESLGFPAIAGNQSPSYSQLSSTGQQANAGTMGYNQQLNDFNLQSALAQQLQSQSQPSAFATDLGYANSASGILSNLAGAGKNGAQAAGGTWICSAMVRAGAMTQDEVKALHRHLYRAFWKRPLKFIQYILFGKLLVLQAEKVGTAWNIWKPQFYDEVMAEKDPAKAVDRYEDIFWSLYRVVQNRKKYGAYRSAHGS